MSTQQLPTPEQVRDFVIAGHSDLDKVQVMLNETPALLNAAYEWKDNDTETAVQAAAHMGHVAIAEFLLAQGAPLEIYTAAMLGRLPDVERLLSEDPELIHATGAHGIPLLTHAAHSNNLALIKLLSQRGAQTGISSALHNAVKHGHETIVRWILKNGQPDLKSQNFQGHTVLEVAKQRQDKSLIELLQAHSGKE